MSTSFFCCVQFDTKSASARNDVILHEVGQALIDLPFLILGVLTFCTMYRTIPLVRYVNVVLRCSHYFSVCLWTSHNFDILLLNTSFDNSKMSWTWILCFMWSVGPPRISTWTTRLVWTWWDTHVRPESSSHDVMPVHIRYNTLHSTFQSLFTFVSSATALCQSCCLDTICRFQRHEHHWGKFKHSLKLAAILVGADN